MSSDESIEGRLVKAVFGLKSSKPDPPYVLELAEELLSQYGRDGLVELYGRFSGGTGHFDFIMRRVIWRGLAKDCGSELTIEPSVGFRHPETFSIGDSVFIGAHTLVQGRHDGCCEIGDHVWIGPGSYFDARDLVLEDHVGWGPGAKVLGSTHTGLPIDIPIIQTDLLISQVRICSWADIGTNAVVLPGVTVGRGAIVGAGAVVHQDVPPFAVVAGVPAQLLHWREGHEPQ